MKNITVACDITIKESMELLDKTAVKVLLVVDEDEKLIGSLTDGDIRRQILKGHDLKDTIETAYNREPCLYFRKILI